MKQKCYGVSTRTDLEAIDPYYVHGLPWREPAVEAYRKNRDNGPNDARPRRPFPQDGGAEWVKEIECSREDLGGDGPIEHFWRAKYTEGPGDRAWMQEKDRNYLTLLGQEVAALLPAPGAPQAADSTGLIAATRELLQTLSAQIATYDFATYERIEQQLLDAKRRLPQMLARTAEHAAAAAASVAPVFHTSTPVPTANPVVASAAAAGLPVESDVSVAVTDVAAGGEQGVRTTTTMKSGDFGLDQFGSIDSTIHFGDGSSRLRRQAPINWLRSSDARSKRAIADYRYKRENGSEDDAPEMSFPIDGTLDYVEETDVDTYLDLPAKLGFFRVRYMPGQRDTAWMQQKDRNYLSRLGREIQLLLDHQHSANTDSNYFLQVWELCAVLPTELRVYEHAKFERIEQQLLDAKRRLPQIAARAVEPVGAAAAGGDPASHIPVPVPIAAAGSAASAAVAGASAQGGQQSVEASVGALKSQSSGLGGVENAYCLHELAWVSISELCTGIDAVKGYRNNRENGTDQDSPESAFPEDGSFDFIGEKGLESHLLRVKYTEGSGDRDWMQEKDRNYLIRLGGEVRGLLDRCLAAGVSEAAAGRHSIYLVEVRDLCQSLSWQLREYEHAKYERIHQELKEAQRRLPEIFHTAPSQASGVRAVGQSSAAAAGGDPAPHTPAPVPIADVAVESAGGVLSDADALARIAALEEELESSFAASSDSEVDIADELEGLELGDGAGFTVVSQDGLPVVAVAAGAASPVGSASAVAGKPTAPVVRQNNQNFFARLGQLFRGRKSAAESASSSPPTSAHAAGPVVSVGPVSSTAPHLIQPDELNLPLDGGFLGTGSFGTVFKGKWHGADVAIKRLNSRNISPQTLLKFQAEAELMTDLHHPNVVHFFGYCSDPAKNYYALVMEYCPKDLKLLLHPYGQAKEPIDWATKIQLGIDAGAGLSYLHDNNLLHRDLKSENILLTEQCRAKLTDFGESKAKISEELESTHTANVGTYRWIAPEVLALGSKSTRYGKPADVYSYAMVLWELSTRELPPEVDALRGGLSDAQKNEMKEKISPDSTDTPPKMAWVIKHGWCHDPAKRRTAKELVEQLEEAQAELSQGHSSRLSVG